MGADGFGSSMIIAAAALLWLVYLVPTWLRRREYLATERNAIRLQQTLRIMAETAEVPTEVRAEFSARSAAQQERLLKKEMERQAAVVSAQDAAAARAASRRLAESQPAIAADIALSSSSSRRLRRSRAITSLILFASLAAVGVGVAQLLTTGAWPLLAGGGLVSAGSLVMLGQMAAVGRARLELARSIRSRPPVVQRVRRQVVIPAVPVRSTWTPVPVPKPLYATMPVAERSLAASLEAAAELRQAAADAERALREAHQEPEVTPIRATSTPSRFSRMGIIDEQQAATTDIDAVLRRRRTAAAG
ncbi:hypothetical protein [Lacisediminihabitans profunda]|uniref:Large exoprotein n=1 Tax=Lacisediminihabitans profunda TaxID=2594790 RepID=A0A5C8USU7_9MICO|nr:hypothetical protein [Lacisediminihabitans profunda]TXN31003.1 hypothetical protein FVP33_05235 [Lacisediminihabitans profunda]